MKWEKVDFSFILAIGYDPASHAVGVKLENGGIYHYFDIPFHVYWNFRMAPSIGAYYNTIIKTYPYKQIREPAYH